jgi:hypothetical protein
MLPTDIMYLVGCGALIILAPFLPSELLFLLDNIIVRILLVGLLVYTIRYGTTVAILSFMTIAILFLERNRRKVGEALKKLDAMEVPKFADVHEAYKKTMPVDVPEFSVPVPKEVDFMPHETCDTDAFEPVDVSINQKTVLRTIYPPEGQVDELYEQMGFGHIEGLT